MRTALLLLPLLLPGLLAAQTEAPPPAPWKGVGGVAAGVIKAGSISGESRLFVGGWAGVMLGNRFSLGGGAVVLTDDVELLEAKSDTGFDLEVGYGGVVLRYRFPMADRVEAEAGTLMGAGHAVVRDRFTGTEAGADNFGLMEPEVGLSLEVLPWLHLSGGVGYRMVWGVEDLPRVEPEDLQSLTASLTLLVIQR